MAAVAKPVNAQRWCQAYYTHRHAPLAQVLACYDAETPEVPSQSPTASQERERIAWQLYRMKGEAPQSAAEVSV